MKISSHLKKLQLVSWAEEIAKIANQRDDKYAVKLIEDEVQAFMAGRFSLAVLGKVKRGKSTFCNAFLGRNDDMLAPINKQPATSIFSEFAWSEQLKCVVHFSDGRIEDVQSSNIAKYVLESENKNNQKGVAHLEIFGPFPDLDKDVTLVDTPGTGSLHEHHDAIVMGLLPQVDAVIFLVTPDAPIDDMELDLLRKLKETDIKKVFFAINKVDDPTTDEDEIKEGIEHNSKILNGVGIPVDKIYRISALKAMEGHDAESGFEELFKDISEFLKQNKLKIMQLNFVGKISKCTASLASNILAEIGAGAKSEAELGEELEQLKRQRDQLAGSLETLERGFQREWRQAVDDFERGIGDAETSVKTKIAKKIEGTSVTQVGNLAKGLPGFLASCLESELQECNRKFERESREAIEQFKLEYPQVVTGSTQGELVIRAGNSSDTLIKGTIAGTGMAIAGYGMAAAAATTAAAVAAANAAAVTAAVSTSIVGINGLTLTLTGAVGGLLNTIGIGSAITPALTTAPAWVAFASPVGWALAGVGALAIPFAYRNAKLKQKEQLEAACVEYLNSTFHKIKTERLPAIRKLGAQIAKEQQDHLKNQLQQLEVSIRKALSSKSKNCNTHHLEQMANRLNELTAQAV